MSESVAMKRLTKIQLAGLIVGVIVFFVPFFFDIPNLEESGERMLSIFLTAITFWVTEAVPLVATSVFVILMEVLLISTDTVIPLGEGVPGADVDPATYFAALANPVIILFLGGFLIADGAAKYGLDHNLAALMLKPFTGSARITVLGLMIITALLSMFMSNTATTATMFAVVIPILARLPEGRARAGLTLAIPVAANVGGIGTPVGTPPNAIAIAALSEAGVTVSFVDWMRMAVPFVLVILAGSWMLLCLLFIPRGHKITLEMTSDWDRSSKAKMFYAVAGLTIILWMTEPLHHISSNTVGFLPVVTLLCFRVMDGNDIKKLDWPVLWLVAGGIALGAGIRISELDKWIVGSIDWKSMGAGAIITALAFIGLGFSTVMSNSAGANLLVPLALSLAASLDDINMITIAAVVAISTSLGMSLPISTPPNAIAYSTGDCSVRDMAVVGLIVGILGTTLLVLALPSLWATLGLV